MMGTFMTLFTYELLMGGDAEQVNIYRTTRRTNITAQEEFQQDLPCRQELLPTEKTCKL